MSMTLAPVDTNNLANIADADKNRRDRVARMAAAAFKQSVTEATQCAGDKCPERKNCQRYRRRSPSAPWASFDIERQKHEGNCIHKIVVKFAPEKRKVA